MWGTDIFSYIASPWSFGPRSILAFAATKLSISAQNISGYMRQNEYETMVRITNVGKVPIRDQKQQWNKDNIQIFVLSLYLGWSRSGWAPRSSRNTWSQRASRKHRQRWAAGPPRRAGETLAFYLTWSFVPVSVLRSLILQLLRLIYESTVLKTPLRRPGAASHWAEPCTQCWVQIYCICFYICVLGRCSHISDMVSKIHRLLKVQSVVDKVHRSSTWVKVQIRIIKYYSSKSTAFSILLEWKYKSTRFFMLLK